MHLEYSLPISKRQIKLVPDEPDDWFFGLNSPDADDGVTLVVEGFERGHVFVGYQSRLKYEWAQRIAIVIDASAPMGDPVKVLHIGAGALSLARHVSLTRPGSEQFVVDDDVELLEFVSARWPPPEEVVHLGRDLMRDLDAIGSRAPFDFVVMDGSSNPFVVSTLLSKGPQQALDTLMDIAPLLGGTGKLVITPPCDHPEPNILTLVEATTAAGLRTWVLKPTPDDDGCPGQNTIIVAVSGSSRGSEDWPVRAFAETPLPTRVEFHPGIL